MTRDLQQEIDEAIAREDFEAVLALLEEQRIKRLAEECLFLLGGIPRSFANRWGRQPA